MNLIKQILFLSACTVIVISAGCSSQGQAEVIKQICVAAPGNEQVIEAAEAVLSGMHFDIDKSDTQQGFIRTRPLSGAQFFELWRDDTVGAFNFAESNMHSIRRIVELQIDQQSGQICLECDVSVQRLDMPEREISRSSQVSGVFSKSTSSMQRLKLNKGQRKEIRWDTLGNDSRLSTEILKRIENKLAALNKGKKL